MIRSGKDRFNETLTVLMRGCGIIRATKKQDFLFLKNITFVSEETKISYGNVATNKS